MTIPNEVKIIITKLKESGFEAYIVGGCVRDFLLDSSASKEPKDWDITTNAKPEQIQKVFRDSFYENNFLTVTVRTGSKKPTLGEIEITTYRSEAKYSDKRHPDEIRFAKNLEEDLSRRDFTVNAMAIEIPNSKLQIPNKSKIQNSKFKIIDPFDGQTDLKNKIIKTVGNPEERLNEDALRILRAVRFAATLGFTIEENTAKAIKKNDIGKPRVKVGEGKESTFYNHEVLGAKMAFQILNRLKFPNKDIEKIVNLIRHHMFYYNVDEVSESSVRRLVKKVGPENMEELLQLR